MRPQCDCCGYLIASWGVPGSVREVKTRELGKNGWNGTEMYCGLCFAKAFKMLGWDFDDADMRQVYEERAEDVNPESGRLRREEDTWYLTHRETEDRDKVKDCEHLRSWENSDGETLYGCRYKGGKPCTDDCEVRK